MYKVGIVGATGFAGAELLRILANHPDVEVTKVVAKFHVDKRFDEVFENFGKICEDTCLDIDLETLAADTDVIFLALPAGLASKKLRKVFYPTIKSSISGRIFVLNRKKSMNNGIKRNILENNFSEKPSMAYVNGNGKKLRMPGSLPIRDVILLAVFYHSRHY